MLSVTPVPGTDTEYEVRPGACSRCKTVVQQDSFPCVKRAPSRQQSSKSDRSGLKTSKPPPYRLPRLSVSQPTLGLTRDRYDDKHDSFQIRSNSFDKFIKAKMKPPGPPNTVAQKMRSDNIHMPTFKHVQFLPVETPRPRTEPELVVARFNVPTLAISNETQPRLARRERQFAGCHSDVAHTFLRQSEPSAIWRLSPYQHTNYDNQAIGGGTGPYSREFRVHCTTPKTWLQMKWSRERTSL